MTDQLNHLVFEPHHSFGKKIGGEPAPFGYISGGVPRIPIFELKPVLKINPDTLTKFALQMAAADRLLSTLKFAVARVKLANSEGDAILSAWLPDAEAAIAAAEGR